MISPLIIYRNTIILLFRSKTLESLSPGSTNRDLRARAAADSITRLAEDLLATGAINFGLIHLYACLQNFPISTSYSPQYLTYAQSSGIIFCTLSAHIRHLSRRIHPAPISREQIPPVHVGFERNCQILACQDMDLKGLREFDEKINRSRPGECVF